MLDPLGQSQVIPYLKELSRTGIRFTLLSFEGPKAYTSAGRERCEKLRMELAGFDIDWHFLRYHKRPSMPATSYDVLAGIRYGSRLVQSKQVEMVHARSHIPATIALRLKRRFGLKMIFDVRGLMAEEYVDANHWKKGNAPYRMTKAMERRALQASDGLVTLTEKIWPEIKDWKGLRDRDVIHEVVPCCTDLDRFRFLQSEWDAMRSDTTLGLTEFAANDIANWGYQTTAFAALTAREFEAAKVALGRPPSALELYLAQLIGSRALGAAIANPAVTIKVDLGTIPSTGTARISDRR